MVALLAAAVVACTSAALTLPATTWTGDGMENNLTEGTTTALAVDPNAASSETAADSSTPESVAPAVEESAPQSAPETTEESEPVQDPETAEEPAGAPQDTNSDANAITVTDSQDTPSVLANRQHSVAVGGTISIEGSFGWNHQWTTSSDCVTLSNKDGRTVQVTGVTEGTAQLTHTYSTFFSENGVETFTVYVTRNSTINFNDLPMNDSNPGQTTVNFYVNIHSDIANSDLGAGNTDSSQFTESVQSTRLVRYPQRFEYQMAGNQYVVIQGDDNGSAYNVDTQIRSLGSNGVDGFIIADFPTDEEVFDALKQLSPYSWQDIEVGNTTITWSNRDEELTTDKYAIRWYVFKYDTSDAWHVDGILVPKYGRLSVTKTFKFQPGLDGNALQELVPNDFEINVRAKDGSNSYALQISQDAEEEKDPLSNPIYEDEEIHVEQGTVTYTWTVDVLNREYTISESNSDVGGYTWTNATYSTHPYEGQGEKNQPLETSFTIDCDTTGTDTGDTAQQSASITNNYTRNTGNLTINKEVSGASVTNKNYTFTIATDMPEVAEKSYQTGVDGESISFTSSGNGTYTATVTVSTTSAEGENNDGTITINSLPTGAYIVTEDESSQDINGYNFVSVTYNNSAEQSGKADVPKDNTAAVNVVNTYESAAIPITIHKVDASNDSINLKGAQFRLYKKDKDGTTKLYYYKDGESVQWIDISEDGNQSKFTTASTADDGMATFTGIPSGTYYLEEIKAPDGYNMLTDAIEVIVVNGTVSLGEDHTGNDAVASVKGKTITVTNSTGVELPATGSIGTTPFATIGGPLFAVCAVGLGFGLRRRRGKEAK